MQGYDGHIIFKELNNFNEGSLQFYNGSLDTLTSNLNNEDFKHLISEFGNDKLDILKRKYEWVDSYEKFKYPSLSEKKYFYSSLKDGKCNRSNGHISDEQYQHLQNIWNIFNFNTFLLLIIT